MSDHHLTDAAFSSLGLVPQLMQGIQAAGFTHCTPIQAQTLRPLLAGTDVAGQAQTGTGKTAAFLLAVFQRLLQVEAAPGRHRNQPRALILAPTRELAIQIHKDAEVLGAHTDLRLVLAYGGTGYDTQRAAIQAGVDVLIGTPGRLIDYFKQHVFDLRAIDAIVLDEADRMFDLGFIKDIRYLLRRMPAPEDRLSMLFSATLSYRVTELAYEHMNNPKMITVDADRRTVDKIRQVVYHPANEEKIPLLLGLLKHMDPVRTMVFVNTKRNAERVTAYLEGNGLSAAVLSGDVPQRKRQSLLGSFLRGELPILVATDVAARGLHIPDVSHVFNYDLPQDAEDYVHRVGRTARAGASGDAISFACEDSAFSLPEIEAYIGLKIDVQPITSEIMLTPLPPAKIQRAERPHHGDRGTRSGPSRGGRDGRHRQRGPRTESAT
jgi:ATP-dependent RNA helicase RhlB